MSAFEKRIERELGVTSAGLRYLASLHATGKASMRGNETGKLFAAGYIVANDEMTVVGRGNWTGRWFCITDAGRDVVKRARAMGW